MAYKFPGKIIEDMKSIRNAVSPKRFIIIKARI